MKFTKARRFHLMACARPGLAFALSAAAIAAQAQPSPARTAQSDVAAAIRSCAATFAAQDEFSGVLALRLDGEDSFYSTGQVKPGALVPPTPETPFNIASVGKLFTATAIGQLIDAGQVDLQEAIGKHLPDLPPHLEAITVGQLLNHSSGVGEIHGPANHQRILAARTATELIPLIAAVPPLSEPGTVRRYSNTGPILLGAIIEKLSGRPFATYVEERIFRPAGMANSSMTGAPEDASTMMTRSEDLTGPMRIGPASVGTARRAVPRPREWAGPYGNAYSSAADLLRFASALNSGKLVSAGTRIRLWSGEEPVPGSGPGAYAYGFQVVSNGARKAIGHSGLRGGANAEVHWAPTGKWSLVVLSNYDPMAATMIANAAKLMLLGMEGPATACDSARRGKGMPGPTVR